MFEKVYCTKESLENERFAARELGWATSRIFGQLAAFATCRPEKGPSLEKEDTSHISSTLPQSEPLPEMSMPHFSRIGNRTFLAFCDSETWQAGISGRNFTVTGCQHFSERTPKPSRIFHATSRAL
jgi:hypothetical protein